MTAATHRVNEETEGVECLMLTKPGSPTKPMQTAKQRATQKQIGEEDESEAEKTNAKDNDANGELEKR